MALALCLLAPPLAAQTRTGWAMGTTPPTLLAAAPAQAPAPAAATAPVAAPAAAPVPARAAMPAPMPALAPSFTAPATGSAEARFDLSVNNAPAAQVFMQLAQGTPYNILVSPELSGQLSVVLKDTTVLEALDTLRELFGYDFRVTGNRVFVYPNTIQTRLYKVNYLPGRRQGASDLRVTSSAITVSGTGSNGSSTSGSTGSTTGNQGTGSSSGGTGSGFGSRADDNAHVRTTSDADFWREVQASLAAMVGSQAGRSVVLNPAAGVVLVRALPSELRQVEGFLKAVQLSIERQVMLEAKIVEVQLTQDAQTGINWSAFGKLGSGQLSIGSAAPGTTIGKTGNLGTSDGTSIAPGVNLAAGALGRGFYGLAFQASNFAALLNFLETQGNVQVLSSPRIATLNNQKAVLKVGSDELYVTGVSSNTTSTGTNTVSSPTLTLQPFFSGISLDVTPQIDDAGHVMLHVHPTISSVVEKSKNIDLGSLGSYKLPLAASTVNETDSIVRVRDGQIVAIGGLMKQNSHNEQTGVPVLSNTPWLGNLFKQTATVVSKQELVILIKPTVIQDDNAWPDAPSIDKPAAAQPIAQR
jgi:MSHA biogenesis protein MshL